MIVVEDVQIIPQQVIIGQQFRLKVRAYEEIEWAEGTLENPIEYKHMMDVTEGLYYKYSKSIWRCLKSKSPCLLFPGTAPNVWEKVKNI